jgi:hypothetical protein
MLAQAWERGRRVGQAHERFLLKLAFFAAALAGLWWLGSTP